MTEEKAQKMIDKMVTKCLNDLFNKNDLDYIVIHFSRIEELKQFEGIIGCSNWWDIHWDKIANDKFCVKVLKNGKTKTEYDITSYCDLGHFQTNINKGDKAKIFKYNEIAQILLDKVEEERKTVEGVKKVSTFGKLISGLLSGIFLVLLFFLLVAFIGASFEFGSELMKYITHNTFGWNFIN